ncbi:VanW family protein [Acetivibrio cellulolyticus]|uniref:VanW family protein n=1 Tax=Acetivibrio cellulolyticus TaxID=35830 RepID=UPI0002481C7F|nr:VanW family protein [Acetivibrio cellulolyticus]
MRSKHILFFLIIMLAFSIISCSNGYSTNGIESDRNLSNAKAEQINYSNNNINSDAILRAETTGPEKSDLNNENGPKSLTVESIKSGETSSFPWENDDKFKAVQTTNDCNELLAGYKTVLRDPLPGEEDNVHLAARYLAGTIVKTGEVFSQNQKVGPYTLDRGFQKGPTYAGTQLITTVGGGVCKIASTLYNVAILSNLQVVERYNHNMPVPYVPYGQDATVSYGAKDFKFKNNTTFPILIWAQGVDNTLYIGFYGKTKPPKVQWHHETLKVYQAEKIYKTNTSLPAGTEKVILEGMDGGVVRSWVTIENPDGTTAIKELGKSYYNPMSYIIEKNK